MQKRISIPNPQPQKFKRLRMARDTLAQLEGGVHFKILADQPQQRAVFRDRYEAPEAVENRRRAYNPFTQAKALPKEEAHEQIEQFYFQLITAAEDTYYYSTSKDESGEVSIHDDSPSIKQVRLNRERLGMYLVEAFAAGDLKKVKALFDGAQRFHKNQATSENLKFLQEYERFLFEQKRLPESGEELLIFSRDTPNTHSLAPAILHLNSSDAYQKYAKPLGLSFMNYLD